MKIAVLSDTHFAARKRENPTNYSELLFQMGFQAFKQAAKADLIIHAGDFFDVKIPRYDDILRVVDFLQKLKKPIFVINGNHERAGLQKSSIIDVLQKTGVFVGEYVGKNKIVKIWENEELRVVGLDYVTDRQELLRQLLAQLSRLQKKGKKNILVLHQNVREYVAGDYISLNELQRLPFDYVILGHIHKPTKHGKIIIPGSTGIVKLNKDELLEPRKIVFIEEEVKWENIENQPETFYVSLEFKEATPGDVRKKLSEVLQTQRGKIGRIKLRGTLKEGYKPADVQLPFVDGIIIDNELFEERASRHFNIDREFDLLNVLKKVSRGKIDIEKLYNLFKEKEEDEILKELLGE